MYVVRTSKSKIVKIQKFWKQIFRKYNINGQLFPQHPVLSEIFSISHRKILLLSLDNAFYLEKNKIEGTPILKLATVKRL